MHSDYFVPQSAIVFRVGGSGRVLASVCWTWLIWWTRRLTSGCQWWVLVVTINDKWITSCGAVITYQCSASIWRGLSQQWVW